MNYKNQGVIWATGRRKTSVASVRFIPDGQGKVTVNSKPIEAYFHGRPHQIQDALAPMRLLDDGKKYDLNLKILGGGLTGQAGAARHAIARAVVKLDEKYRRPLRAEGHLTRDPRMVERKKSGQPKARKRFQYSKR